MMTRLSIKALLGFAYLVFAAVPLMAQTGVVPSIPTQPYVWKNVRMDGMGYVTGLIVHPKDPNLVYIRTDVAGCYRWDHVNQSWIPLMDTFGKVDWPGGIESIAVDPFNTSVVYAAGTFGKIGDIYRSNDQGNTWSPLGLRLAGGAAIDMPSNQPYRGCGERLAVNPKNGESIFFGSVSNGLFHTSDSGKTWSVVASLPNPGVPKFGVTFVQFSLDGKSLLAGVSGAGVYRSTDEGATWSLVAAGPSPDAFPCRAAPDTAGNFYVTFASLKVNAGGVYKISASGASTNVTPPNDRGAYVGIAVDPKVAQRIVTYAGSFSARSVYVSADGGATWTTYTFQYHVPQWWPKYQLAAKGAFGYSSAIDVLPTGEGWAADGFGVYHTDNFFAAQPIWTAEMHDLEELVVLGLVSPTQGVPLVSGSADMHGFVHTDLDTVPPKTLTNGEFGDTDSLDFCESHPNVLVWVGGGENDGKASNGYSTDGGLTWRPFGPFPDNYNNGKVAISAVDPNLILWAPTSNHWDRTDPLSTVNLMRSTDGGQTWQPIQGAQPNLGVLGMWFGSSPLASDRVDGTLFYYYEQSNNIGGAWHGARMRVSTDGGATWQITANLPDWYEVSVKAVPGIRGDVWVGYSNGQALYRSTNAGVSFAPIPGLDKVWQFAFGKNKPGASYATVYVLAGIHGVYGLFRSDDFLSLPASAAGSAHWVRINGTEGLGAATCMVGDRQLYGRVYVGTGGRGILYGTLSAVQSASTATP